MTEQSLITDIVNTEWEMFQDTQNIGGRAWCQDDRNQFDANRYAQFEAWDENSCRQYRKDLHRAKTQKINLVSCKYAYMMKDTSPKEYEGFRDQLPEISETKEELIDGLLQFTLQWGAEFARKYPCIAAGGRPLRQEDALPGQTSAECYSRGELATYSEETLKSLLAHYRKTAAHGTNLYQQIIRRELEILYGRSLEELEAILAGR